jgi:hypothetical protein
MRLGDVARPANDCRHGGVVEQRRLRAERDLAEFVRAVALAAERRDFAAVVGVESRKRRQMVEFDIGVGPRIAGRKVPAYAATSAWNASGSSNGR